MVFTVIVLGFIRLLAGVLGWPYWLALLCTSEICTVLRFLVLDYWVFRTQRPTWKRLWQYHVSNAVAFGIWWSVANVLRAAGVHYLLAALFAIPCTIGLNLLSDFQWTWRQRKLPASSSNLPP